MNLYQIRYFLAIAETQGFTKAAERLGVSQPSLSAGIKKLEQELGVILFERGGGGRRALLTPAGQLFADKARAIVEQYQSALSELRHYGKYAVLRLGVLCTLRVADIAPLVGQFHRQYPTATLELRDGRADMLRDWLAEGDIDLALTVLDRTPQADELELFSQRYLLAVGLEHPFAERDRVSIADIDGQTYIERVRCELYVEQPDYYERAGIKRQIAYKADQEEWAITLVAAGLGISVMPHWRDLTTIAYVPVEEIDVTRQIGLRWRPRQTSDLVESFRDLAREQVWTS